MFLLYLFGLTEAAATNCETHQDTDEVISQESSTGMRKI